MMLTTCSIHYAYSEAKTRDLLPVYTSAHVCVCFIYTSGYLFFSIFKSPTFKNGQKAEHWGALRKILFEHFLFSPVLYELSVFIHAELAAAWISKVHYIYTKITTKSCTCMVNVGLPSANTSWTPNHIRKQIKYEIPNLMNFGLPGCIHVQR